MEASAGWTRVIDVLVRVEDVPADDSGLLSFGGDQAGGGILVERGRICWAAAPGLQRRLKDLLITSAARTDIDFDRIYERCRTNGSLLGQTLVDEGWISSHELEQALRRHTAESLIELSRGGDTMVWTSRGSRGYSPRFTFRPVDLLLEVVTIAMPQLQHAARLELAKVERADRRGAAFCSDIDYEVAVPIATFGDMPMHELLSLGRWAMLVPLVTRELGTTPSFTLSATATGDTIAVWWRGPVLYAVACDDRSSVAALTASHLEGESR
jgi:hypothetical protein